MNEREQTGMGSDPGRDPRDERLRSLLQAAYPAAEPDEALERSVAEMAARHAVRATRRREWWRLPFRWEPTLGAVAAAALLVVLGLMLAHRDHRHSTRSPAPSIAANPHPPRSEPGPRFRPPTPQNDRGPQMAALPPIQ